MKKRNRSRRRQSSSERGNLLDVLSGRAKRRRRTWTFEQLEERHLFSANPLTDYGAVSSLSSNTPEGLQQILDNELSWWVLQAANAQAGSLASMSTRALPNDPYLDFQWHLINTGQLVGNPNFQDIVGTPGEDINVAGAWDLGYTGAGVVVAVVDTGVQTEHPDLINNIHPTLQFDFLNNDEDANPRSLNDPTLAHGTAVAALIAADGDNNEGVTGVAYNAQIVPIRLIDGGQTEQAFINMFLYENQQIDIYNHSWGPAEGVRTVRGPSPGELEAIRQSVFGESSGRGGLGNIQVFASGNGAGPTGTQGFPGVGVLDSSSYDGYVTSRYTIGVGGVDHDGSYNTIEGSVNQSMEAGPAILVAAPTGSVFIPIGNDTGTGSGIWTADFVGDNGINEGPVDGVEIDLDPFPDPDYTSRFNGTSAAAPIASGVIALMLEANPNLSWRDVQEILVRSSRQADQFEDPQTGGGAQIGSNSWLLNPFPFFVDPDYILDMIPVVDPYAPFPDVYTPNFFVTQLGNIAGFGTNLLVAHEDYKPLRAIEYTNGAGYTVSHGRGAYGEEYGYGHGVVDAELAVQLARQWHSQGQNLPDERTFSTVFTVQGGLEVHAGEEGNMDTGLLFVPGAVGGIADDEFIDYWNEYFVDNDPTMPDDGPFVDYMGPTAANRGFFYHYEIPDSNAMSVEWVEMKLDISGDANAYDGLRITLVSPDGTQSELNNFQQLGIPGNSVQSPVFLPVLTDPPGTIVPGDADTLVWTFSTNRNWGERYDPQLVIDPTTGLPLLDEPITPTGIDVDRPVFQGWQLIFENWSTEDLPLNGIEVIWHGSPIDPASQRIQGLVGFDGGRNGVGAGDDDFNFQRFIQFPSGDNNGDMVIDVNDYDSDGDGNPNLGTLIRQTDLTQEEFLANVTVVATRVSDGQEVGRFVTGADGNFYFDLVPDEYVISIDAESLTGGQFVKDEPSVPALRQAHYQKQWHITTDWFNAPNVDSSNLFDYRVITDATGAPEKFISPFDGLPVPTGVKNLNFLVDPGPQPANEIAVSGLVYVDIDGDGVFNNDDASDAGFKVFWDTNGSGMFEATDLFVETHELMTDAQGNLFNYTLTIDTAVVDRFLIGAVPPNAFWTATSPVTGLATIFGGPGDAFPGTDFGFKPPEGSIDPPPVLPGAITGIVFEDSNNDGVRQAGEDGVSGFRVYVDLDLDGEWDADDEPNAITNIFGAYFLADVDPDSYSVGIIVESPWQLTSPVSGFRLVDVASAETERNVSFGIRNLATGDFGDLPDSYRTTQAQNGPRHEIIPGFRLGARIDGEVNGQPSAGATGDDMIFNDEDGVVLLGAVTNPTGVLVQGVTNVVQATVFGVGGYLNAWMDFNKDGDFEDTVGGVSEHVLVDVDLNPGTNSGQEMRIDVPTGLKAGRVPTRFRWGTAGLSFDGPATIGEVEDYLLPNSPPTPRPIDGDFNGSGLVDQADYGLWKSTFGSLIDLTADGSGNGVVDLADYTVWRDHLGESAPPGGGSGGGGAATSSARLSDALASYRASGTHVEVSPQVAANLERLGYVPVTVRFGINGTQTVYMLPEGTSTPATSSPVASNGRAIAEVASVRWIATPEIAVEPSRATASLRHFVGQHGSAADAARSVDSALLQWASLNADQDRSDQDDDSADAVSEWLTDKGHHDEAFDLALAAFEENGDWWSSI